MSGQQTFAQEAWDIATRLDDLDSRLIDNVDDKVERQASELVEQLYALARRLGWKGEQTA